MGYAHILKYNNGKPSGYRECDGEVAYMPEQESYENIFRRVNVDIETMKVLNYDFIKDRQCVYRKGVLLRGILPDNFHVLNAVYIGNEQVIYTPYGDAKIAHPSTFEVLDDGIHCGQHFSYSYGRDEEFVYYFTGSTDTRYAIKLKACQNPKKFTVLSKKYAKDDQHVYLEGVTIKGANPETFTVLSNHYAHDGKHVFRVCSILKKANPATFTVLSDFYSCDDKHVYSYERLIEANAKTFFVLQDGYAKDCNHLFHYGDIVDEKVKPYNTELDDK